MDYSLHGPYQYQGSGISVLQGPTEAKRGVSTVRTVTQLGCGSAVVDLVVPLGTKY